MITVLYSGNVGIGQDVDTVLRAAARLNGNGGLRILIVGNGKRLSLVRELAAQLHLQNAEFRAPGPPVPTFRIARRRRYPRDLPEIGNRRSHRAQQDLR